MNYRPQGFSILPPVIKNLIIINGIFWLASFTGVASRMLGVDFQDLLALHFPLSDNFYPFQIVTHMFMHSTNGFGHILLNMFALWMFGTQLENMWGSKKFLIYYMVAGLGAAFLHEAVLWIEIWNASAGIPEEIVRRAYIGQVTNGEVAMYPKLYDIFHLVNTPVVGASGAVYGILLGYGMMFPNSLIYIYFLFPIKAKYFVMIFAAMELLNGLSDAASPIAHFAHLGGMLFGYLLYKYWQKNPYKY